MLNLSRIPKERLEEIDNLDAYIYKMAQNEALRFRSKSKHLQDKIDDSPSVYSDRFQGARQVENRALLNDIWTHLNADERNVLQLIIFGCGAKEIAARMGITYDAARQRISRLRKSLRNLVFDTVE
jgi:RNA polymerase sigma factor (sigma-70 family)